MVALVKCSCAIAAMAFAATAPVSASRTATRGHAPAPAAKIVAHASTTDRTTATSTEAAPSAQGKTVQAAQQFLASVLPNAEWDYYYGDTKITEFSISGYCRHHLVVIDKVKNKSFDGIIDLGTISASGWTSWSGKYPVDVGFSGSNSDVLKLVKIRFEDFNMGKRVTDALNFASTHCSPGGF